MKYIIEIEMDNEAFDPTHGTGEIVRQLEIIAEHNKNGITPPILKLRDINGNSCGETRIENE